MARGRNGAEFGAGLGLGIGFVAAGALCLGVPGYLGWGETFWFALGAVLGIIGVVGAAIELEKVLGSESGFGYIAASLAVFGVGGLLHLLQARDVVTGSVASAARLLAVVLTLFAMTGLGMGMGQLMSNLGGSGNTQSGLHPGRVFISLVIALLGLATAVLNFLSAGS